MTAVAGRRTPAVFGAKPGAVTTAARALPGGGPGTGSR
jgi:hypothetical protein